MVSLRLLLAVSYLVAAVSSVPFTKSSAAPSFCHDLDCPAYTVLSKKGDYELRQYNATKWVGTTIANSDDWNAAADTGFDRLFQYISGANSANEKIPMASPVATKVVPIAGTGKFNFTILFFTPFKYQTNTPTPTDPTCALVDLPVIKAYVVSFGGYAKTEEVLDKTTTLGKTLDREGASYVKDFSFEAGYDPPYRVIGRHNEVWLLAA